MGFLSNSVKFTLIQDIQAGMKGYKLTEEKECVPLVSMEPIKGGALKLAFQMILNKFLQTIIQMSAFQVGLYVLWLHFQMLKLF